MAEGFVWPALAGGSGHCPALDAFHAAVELGGHAGALEQLVFDFGTTT